MLKFKEKIQRTAASVVFDEYIPFYVNFDFESIYAPNYWRVGDGRRSLMEIGLDRDSGAVNSITLTSVNVKNLREISNSYIEYVSEVDGLPTFDLSPWVKQASDDDSSRFIDEFNVDLDLELGQNCLSVSIIPKVEPVKYIKNSNILFGLGLDDTLVKIDIIDLSEEDIIAVRNAV